MLVAIAKMIGKTRRKTIILVCANQLDSMERMN